MRRTVRLLVALLFISCGGGGGHGPDAGVDGTGGGSFDAAPDAGSPCGNSVLDTGEQCDDGNGSAGDGCDATCHVELGYVCPTVGAPCVREVYCGDGVVDS